MNSDKCGIYLIKCIPTGKSYVGSSSRIYRRWDEHRKSLERRKSNCRYLQYSWSKYGKDCFSFEVIEECTKELLEVREQHYIDTLRPKLNVLTNVSARLGPDMLARRAASLKARAAKITHCPSGHEYTEANTYRNAKGNRICRACNALRVAAIFANETTEQRELRRAKTKARYLANRETIAAKMREYALAHKDQKRAYDKAYRLRKAG